MSQIMVSMLFVLSISFLGFAASFAEPPQRVVVASAR